MRRVATWFLGTSAAALLALGAAGCDQTTYTIDPFPVSVDFATHGVPVVFACTPGVASCDSDRLAVLDTGTAVSVIEPEGGAAAGEIRRRNTSLELRAFSDGVARARFTSFTVLAMEMGNSGISTAAPLQPQAVIGSDVLSRVAVRLDPQASSIFFFPEIAGDGAILARTCAAVLPAPLAGGGTYALENDEVEFPASRMVVGACLEPDPPPASRLEMARPKGLGADALLVLATGLPVTVISRSAYRRARPADDIDALPAATLWLPGSNDADGEPVHIGSLSWIGLAADALVGQGPCAELLGSRMMDLGGCKGNEPCPCASSVTTPSRTVSCGVGGSVEMAGPIQVAIVEDDSLLLASLRVELSPQFADVDGFLGMNAINELVTDIDYPGGRLVLRCAVDDGVRCTARPAIDNVGGARNDLLGRGCLLKQAWLETPPDGTEL